MRKSIVKMGISSFLVFTFLLGYLPVFIGIGSIKARASSSYEETIYSYLTSQIGINAAAACGVLANFDAESGLNPKNLQNLFESTLGYSDDSYTTAVDNRSYTNFVHDVAGYGLAQWTHYSRKQGLYNKAQEKGTSIGDINTQLEFFVFEVTQSGVLNYLRNSVENSRDGAGSAASYICYQYEKPANTSAAANSRSILAKNTYWTKYGENQPNNNFTVDPAYPTPITVYPAATSGLITVYNSSLVAYSTSVRNILFSDLCTINAVYTNGYCNITYPTSSGTNTEYAKTSDFIPSSSSIIPYYYYPSENETAYTRSNMSSYFGQAFTTDKCTVVGQLGSIYQIIYPISGGYKMGWIDVSIQEPSIFPTPIFAYPNSSSGKITVYDDSYAAYNQSVHYIAFDDYCTINAVYSNGFCNVTYPTGSGTFTANALFSDFVPPTTALTTFYSTSVTAQTSAYTKSDMASSPNWLVYVGDIITVVGKSGNTLQVIYPLDAGGYKLAWIYNTNVVKNLTGVSITSQPATLTCFEGADLNINGLVVTASYDDGSTANITSSCSLSGYNSVPGVKTVIVTYQGISTAFTVTVISKSPTGIEITSFPSKTTYYVGDRFNAAGSTAKITFDNGTNEFVNDLGFVESVIESGDVEQYVYYTYNNITLYAAIPIAVTVPTISFTPVNSNITVGETLMLTAVTEPDSQVILWESSNTDVGTVENGEISALSPGNVTITASFDYEGNTYSAVQSVTVVNADIFGDANNDGLVNLKDVVVIRRYLAGGWGVIINEVNADVNADSFVNLKDVVLINRFLAGGWGVVLGNPTTPEITYETFSYGKSELGRDLICHSVSPESYTQTILMTYAIHGFEDAYSKDGQVLVNTANALIDYYKTSNELKGCRLLIVPCANPDGLIDGTTNNGFGRCNANGVDLNRDFDANYSANTTPGRNYTPYAFSASESRALRDLYNDYNPSVVIDFHGWLNCTIGDSEIAEVFTDELGLPHQTGFSSTNANGYFANWAHQQGALGLLVEFTDTNISTDNVQNAVNRLINGDYDNGEGKYIVSSQYSDLLPIKCYTLSTGHVTTYKDINGEYSGYIDGGVDLCTINKIYENGWVKVTYPISSGEKTAFCYLSDFIESALTVEHYLSNVPSNTVVYRRMDISQSIGSVWTTDTFTVVAESDNLLQIIYPLDAGGFKLGWIYKA